MHGGSRVLPDGIEQIMPASLNTMVSTEINDVSLPVIVDFPPLGITPLRKAMSPGIPDEAQAGSNNTVSNATEHKAADVPVQTSQALNSSSSSRCALVQYERFFWIYSVSASVHRMTAATITPMHA